MAYDHDEEALAARRYKIRQVSPGSVRDVVRHSVSARGRAGERRMAA